MALTVVTFIKQLLRKSRMVVFEVFVESSIVLQKLLKIDWATRTVHSCGKRTYSQPCIWALTIYICLTINDPVQPVTINENYLNAICSFSEVIMQSTILLSYHPKAKTRIKVPIKISSGWTDYDINDKIPCIFIIKKCFLNSL